MSTQPRTRTFEYGAPKRRGLHGFRKVSGIVLPALLMTACSGSPANVDQPWVWRQGPGNVDEIKKRRSTEPRNQKPMAPDIEVSDENDRYTQAVRYDNLLYVSGQIPIDLKSLKLVGETIEEQTQAVMNNLQNILNENGMTMSNIVSVTLYLTEINDLDKVNDIYETYFRRALPARAVIAVADLPRGSRLEISVIAGN